MGGAGKRMWLLLRRDPDAAEVADIASNGERPSERPAGGAVTMIDAGDQIFIGGRCPAREIASKFGIHGDAGSGKIYSCGDKKFVADDIDGRFTDESVASKVTPGNTVEKPVPGEPPIVLLLRHARGLVGSPPAKTRL